VTDTFCIGLDWGASNLRAYRMDCDGHVLEARASADGVKTVACHAWEEALRRVAGDWLEHAPKAIIVLSGMVGSRNGWIEIPYVAAPADPAAIAGGCQRAYLSDGRPIWFAPGVSTLDRDGVPDVMRGEETQIIGLPTQARHTVCLPGTHSKWATVEHGAILGFSTYFTGELFELLARHSIVGSLIVDGPFDRDAYLDGVRRAGQAGHLLHHIFGARALTVTGGLAPEHLSSYLSGLLIGHEIAAALAMEPGHDVTILGSQQLCELYAIALSESGVSAQIGDLDAAAIGQFRIAQSLMARP
jgi:2-dehydro-3-deoxygalactonokinase